MLAGTYAIAPGTGSNAAPATVVYAFSYFPDLNSSRPALALFAATPTGVAKSGVEVRLVNITSNLPSQTAADILETKFTDSIGWVRFENLSIRYPNRVIGLELRDQPGRTYEFAHTNSNSSGNPVENIGQIRANVETLGTESAGQIVSLVFIDSMGLTVQGADVYVWQLNNSQPPPQDWVPPGGWSPYKNGTTDANGFYIRSEPLASGSYALHVAKGSLNTTWTFTTSDTSDFLRAGPDAILAFVGLLFLPLLLPIMAMVLAYDAIAKERAEGSLDLLISKPVSRIGVATGKLIGVFGSMAIPVSACLIGAAAVIWLRAGQAPSSYFVASLVGDALFLLLAFTAVFLAISALIRNVGTALLISSLFFLVFAFFWGLIGFLLASLFAQPGSVRWFDIVVALAVLSPTGTYQQLLAASLPVISGFPSPVVVTMQRLPFAIVASAAIVWIAVPLALFLWGMKYQVTEV